MEIIFMYTYADAERRCADYLRNNRAANWREVEYKCEQCGQSHRAFLTLRNNSPRILYVAAGREKKHFDTFQ